MPLATSALVTDLADGYGDGAGSNCWSRSWLHRCILPVVNWVIFRVEEDIPGGNCVVVCAGAVNGRIHHKHHHLNRRLVGCEGVGHGVSHSRLD